MFVSEDLQVNAQGHLTIGGQDTVELAKQYGTPLYVMDEDLIRKHCRSFKQSIDKFYQGKGLACYASKAFSCQGNLSGDAGRRHGRRRCFRWGTVHGDADRI